MLVPVVDVRVVGVSVGHSFVLMGMAIRLSRRVVGRVFVLVVFVVDVAVVMLNRLVPVFVVVPLRQVQPDADPHQCRRHAQADRNQTNRDVGSCLFSPRSTISLQCRHSFESCSTPFQEVW